MTDKSIVLYPNPTAILARVEKLEAENDQLQDALECTSNQLLNVIEFYRNGELEESDIEDAEHYVERAYKVLAEVNGGVE